MKWELSTLIGLAAASPVLAAGVWPTSTKSSLDSSTRRPFGVAATARPTVGPTTCAHGILALRGGAVHPSATLSDLEGEIQSAALQGKLVVIDFTATWCGPCKLIAPVFEELSDEFSSRAKFIKVDVDENSDAAQRYGVSAMPTFLFIKGGEVVEKVMGANAERLREVIEVLA